MRTFLPLTLLDLSYGISFAFSLRYYLCNSSNMTILTLLIIIIIKKVHNKLEVRYLSVPDTPTLPLDATDREPTSADREEWSDAVHRSLCAVLQVCKVGFISLFILCEHWFEYP